MKSQFIAVGMGISRHVLTLAAGWLVAKGYVSGDDANQLVGALVAIVGIVWSAQEKTGTNTQKSNAIEPSEITEQVVITDPESPKRKYPL